jgi:cell division protein FtsX
MRTRLIRGKFWLLFMTLGMLLAVAGVALADVIVNTLDDSIENQREIS